MQLIVNGAIGSLASALKLVVEEPELTPERRRLKRCMVGIVMICQKLKKTVTRKAVQKVTSLYIHLCSSKG